MNFFNNQKPEKLLEIYSQMLLIRRFEEKASQLYGMGLINGFCHLYIGQEAVVVGLNAIKQPQDTVITTYREHGHMLVAGCSPDAVMAELTGRFDGTSKGKGGSMHLFSPENNFYGGHGIVGSSASLGTGMAFAHKYKGEDAITFSYMGDGAANQGQVAESYNMAALWQLPIIYVIENNKYSMGTSTERHVTNDQFYERGAPYKIPGESADGMDVLEVQRAGKRAADYVRSGKGPYILQIETYRYRGHSMSDPGKYRTKEEVDNYRNNLDPLTRLKTQLLEKNICTEEELKIVETEVKKQIKQAADFAQYSPEPPESELFTDILKEAF